jgi:hypothetical protein
MSNTFIEESVIVADEFIRTICFVDDEVVFQSDSSSDHIIDANTITKVFAQKGKACSFFNFQSVDEHDSIFKLIKISDVCVLDWKLTLPKPDISEIKEGTEEEDVPESSDRGRHAKDIISEIIKSPNDSPKLIILYTAETEVNPIYNAIKELFNGEIVNEDLEGLWFQNSKFRLSIYFKPTRITSHQSEITKKVANYSDIPEIVCKEFAQLTSGLISNVVLKSISTLRDNTNRLLQLYRKELDPAYLAHRAMLCVPEEAELLLKDSILSSIDSILSYSNVTKGADITEITKWIDGNSNFCKSILRIKDTDLTIDKDTLKIWQKKGYFHSVKTLWETIQSHQVPENKIRSTERDLHKFAIEYFCPNESSFQNLNEDFAILTHHDSNLLSPSYVPKLTLGTVIQRYSQFYLCIQQKCDSVRIDKSSSRSFLFLPMEESNNHFSIIYKDLENKYIKLKLKNRNSHNLVLFDFFETENGSVYAKKEWNYFKFFDTHRRSYKWILDLKEAHAQKFVNEYAANLSRVGLDESEWLRRNSND